MIRNKADRRLTKDASKIVIPYTPRPLQLAIHQALWDKRFGAMVTHRRFGKTVFGVNHLIQAAIASKKDYPQFAYIAPTYGQAKRTAWDYMKRYTAPLKPRINENELRVDIPLNNSRIYLFGADNMETLRGLYLDGAILDEYGTMKPGIFVSIIRPALSDREGWVLFSGTPNGKNEFYDMCELAQAHPEEWFYGCYKASETGLISKSELIMLQRQMSPEKYAQEFECSFESPVEGAFFSNEIDAVIQTGRLTRVPHDPNYQVETWSDIGIADATATWFTQTIGRECRVIEYEEYHAGMPEIVQAWHKKPYNYLGHTGPHDLKVRDWGSGRSRIEAAASLGIHFNLAPNLSFDDGINAAKSFFPLCIFDKQNSSLGWEALKNYRRRKNEATGEFGNTAVHNWASHGADGFRYLATSHKFTTKREKSEKRRPVIGLSWL